MSDIHISKSQVNKAGELLRKERSNDNALNILAFWRNKYIYPLELAYKLLKTYTDKIGNHAIFGQRLKRANSIISKLERMASTRLSSMQDIGGCRVILTNSDKLRNLYQNAFSSKNNLS